MSNPASGTSTPRVFTSQVPSAEDALKSQTVGLVQLADFRKRRADVLEQNGGRSGTMTPDVETDSRYDFSSHIRTSLKSKVQCE